MTIFGIKPIDAYLINDLATGWRLIDVADIFFLEFVTS
jgi:hypothetical protein